MGIISGALGVVGGVTGFLQGRAQQKKAQSYIDNFRWNDLQNPYKNLQVSTLGADFQREQANIAEATAVNALQSGGNRAIIGGLGRLVAGTNNVNRQIATSLDEQQKQIDFAAAQDEQQIRAMKEKRQADELAGYGAMLNQGIQTQNQGIGTMINGFGMAGQAIQGMKGDSDNRGQTYQPSYTPNVDSSQILSSIAPTGRPYLSGGMTYGMGNNSYLNQ